MDEWEGVWRFCKEHLPHKVSVLNSEIKEMFSGGVLRKIKCPADIIFELIPKFEQGIARVTRDEIRDRFRL